MLKEADGAFLANQNFHEVEAGMTRTPDLTNPGGRRPPQSPLFPSIHRPIPFPALFCRPGLHLDEDQHLALEDDEIQLVAPMPPVEGEATAAAPTVIRLGLPLADIREILDLYALNDGKRAQTKMMLESRKIMGLPELRAAAPWVAATATWPRS